MRRGLDRPLCSRRIRAPQRSRSAIFSRAYRREKRTLQMVVDPRARFIVARNCTGGRSNRSSKSNAFARVSQLPGGPIRRRRCDLLPATWKKRAARCVYSRSNGRVSFAPGPLEAGESLWPLGTKEISKEVAEGAHCRGKRPFSVR